MYDGLWQDEEKHDDDAWGSKKERELEGKLIVWIRHEATYSAIRPGVTGRPEIGESKGSCPRQM